MFMLELTANISKLNPPLSVASIVSQQQQTWQQQQQQQQHNEQLGTISTQKRGLLLQI